MKNVIYFFVIVLLFIGCASEVVVDKNKKKEESLVLETIDFAGFTWIVKSGYCLIGNKAGPGPNYYCGDEEDIWVDVQGRLHMKINYKESLSAYGCVSIKTPVSGCGTYRYHVEDGPNGTPDDFDENVVLGLFTYDDVPAYDNYEIDIEISDWGDSTPDYNLWYVTWEDSQSTSDSFLNVFGDGIVEHAFTWQPSAILFNSTKNGFLFGDSVRTGSAVYPCPTEPIYARINFWLVDGDDPGSEQEVVINSFEYDPFVILGAPTGLTATATGETTIELEWNDNSSGEGGVEVERKELGGSYSLIDTLEPESVDYEDTNLSSGTTYVYRVRTVDDYDEVSSYSSEAQATTTGGDPSLSEIDFSCDGWDGYVEGTVDNMPSGSWHVRTWIKSNKWWCEGEDLSPEQNGDFHATHGLWCTPGPGVDIYVALYDAATDPWGTGDCDDLELGEWPDDYDYLFGPFETQ